MATASAGDNSRLTRGQTLSYALGSVGTAGFATVPGLLLAYYLTNSLGVAAGVAAFVLLLPKLWDVAFLPIVGNLSDRSVAKRGSRRPFLLLGGLALPALFALMFAAPDAWSPVAGAVWVFVFFLLAASAFAFFQVPYIATPAEITDSSRERTTMVAWRVGFLTFGILLFGAGSPAIRDAYNATPEGYLIMGVVVGVLIGLGMIGCWWGLRRTRILHKTESEPSFKAQFAVARGNRTFRVLLGAFFLQALATSSMLAGAQYFATYILERERINDVLFVCLVAPGILFVPVWAKIAHKFGKKRGYLFASLTFLVGTLLLLTAPLLPLVGVLVFVAICGVGYAGMQMFPLSMLPDAIAVDAAESGKRRAGAYTGFWTAGETTGFAIGPALVLALLAVTGFVSSTANETVTQPSSAITGTLLAFTLLPAALLVASLPLLLRYDLTDERIAAARALEESRDHDDAPLGEHMSLPADAADSADILAELDSFRSEDAPVHGGRVLAYVYDSGISDLHEVANRALTMYSSVNGLDPTVFPSVTRIENDLVGWGLDLLGGPPEGQGLVTSGGTESCMLAVKAAREHWRQRVGPERAATVKPVMIMPVTAHSAFVKGGYYFDVDVHTLPVDPETFKVRVEDVAAALDEYLDRAALVVVSAPSYAHGVVDPVAEVAALGLERGVPVHTDACIGGWTLPYLARLGVSVPSFDLSVPGVCSISVDLHKYGYAPKGTSLLLFKDADYRLGTFFTYSSWPGYPVVNTTMQSTKSAGPPAAAWAVLRRIGDAGFERLVGDAWQATGAIVAAVQEIPGLRILGTPQATLVAIAADGGPDNGGIDPFVLADRMTARGWFIQAQPGVFGMPRNAHLTVQATTLANLTELLAALQAAAAEASQLPWAEPDPGLIEIAGTLDPTALDLPAVTELLAFAGLDSADGPALPAESANIQALLEALPPALRNRLLAGFFSDIFTANR